ncbi:MAG: hypothetical protein PVSMB4_20040 [Ktedonobacterales bacterium]
MPTEVPDARPRTHAAHPLPSLWPMTWWSARTFGLDTSGQDGTFTLDDDRRARRSTADESCTEWQAVGRQKHPPRVNYA